MDLEEERLSESLGMKSYTELNNLLREQLSKLFRVDISSEKLTYKNNIIKLPVPSNKYLCDNYRMVKKEGICKLPCFSNRGIKGWKVLLNSNTDNKKNFKKENLVRYNKEIIPYNTSLTGSLDRSHLLAAMFKLNVAVTIKPLCWKNGTYTDFFSKKNEYDIVPLFKGVNEGNSSYHTQVWYEEQIYHLLDGNNRYKHKYNVYYEVQAIYTRETDKMPIGIRMLYGKLDNDKFKGDPVHVFVPNVGDIKLLTREGYRNVFKKLMLE